MLREYGSNVVCVLSCALPLPLSKTARVCPVGVGTATNFRTVVYHGTEVRTAIRTAIYRVTCNFGRDHQFAPKYKGHT